ncbi:hypothetical protein FRC08_003143 [Ceratobasidium sp. 394]|nr:hypothetical protein FRC08_003143 [Ceratobasidium sp. 394]
MLQSLSVPVLANKGFTKFLSHNVYLEELDLASCLDARLSSSIDQVGLRDQVSTFSALESFGLEEIERWKGTTALKEISLPEVHDGSKRAQT